MIHFYFQNFKINYIAFVFISLAAQVQVQQPLLGHLDMAPGIHTIQESQESYADEVAPESAQGPIDAPTSSPEGVPGQFIVKKKIAQNHIEELNFRLQNANLANQAASSDDVNPSVGDTSEKSSDVNIQQLESTVSSLSDNTSSTVNSPEADRSEPKTRSAAAVIGYKSIETDF